MGKIRKVMHEFKEGELHSRSKKGPKVTSRQQAVAIAMSEERKMKGKKLPPWLMKGKKGKPKKKGKGFMPFKKGAQDQADALDEKK